MSNTDPKKEPRTPVPAPPDEVDDPIAGYVSSTRISYAELAELVVTLQWPDSPRSAQIFRSNARAWCKHHSVQWTSPAHFTLASSFPAYVRKFEDQPPRSGGPSTKRARQNVLTAARHMHRMLGAIRLNDDLPLSFAEALRWLLEKRGWEVKDLMKALYDQYYREIQPSWYAPQIYKWVDETGAPGRSWRGDSRTLLRQIEELFELPPETLVRRAYATFAAVKLGSGAPIPYRLRKEELKAYPYRLKQLPEQFSEMWIDFVDWRRQEFVALGPKTHDVNDHYRWTSTQTIEMAEQRLRGYFGFLCLPRAKPGTPPDAKEHWKSGKGLKVEELTLAHLFDVSLLFDYVLFLRRRQHQASFTHSGTDFLILINSFVSMPYSFLYSNNHHVRAFRDQLGIEPSAWPDYVEEIHQSILEKLRTLKRKIVVSRSADDPLRHVLNDEQPLQLLLELVDAMERDMPPKARSAQYASGLRDMVIVRILLEVPLRSKNLRTLKIGSSIYKEQNSGLWRIFVPKEEMKNWASSESHDIDRRLSGETSDWIDLYLTESRPHLCGAEKSELLLLKSWGGPQRVESWSDAQMAYDADGLRKAIAKHTTRYFGAPIGPNFFRHALATAQLKDNPNAVGATAALLNNSPNTVLKTYKHITQLDGLRSHDTWKQQQVEKHRASKKKNRKRQTDGAAQPSEASAQRRSSKKSGRKPNEGA